MSATWSIRTFYCLRFLCRLPRTPPSSSLVHGCGAVYHMDDAPLRNATERKLKILFDFRCRVSVAQNKVFPSEFRLQSRSTQKYRPLFTAYCPRSAAVYGAEHWSHHQRYTPFGSEKHNKCRRPPLRHTAEGRRYSPLAREISAG